MGFLKNLVKNAVNEGISKGISDAVSSAAEKIIAPKAEAYAGKVADSFDEAAKAMDSAAENSEEKSSENSSVSSLEESLNKLAKAAEKYAAAMEGAAVSQEKMAEEWKKKLPGFPVWCFGGTDFWFDENGKTPDGNPYYIFNADNASMEGLDMYVRLLKEDGFVQKYPGSDEVLYKDLGGEYLVFGKTDAFGAAPVMSIYLCRTSDRSEIEI